MQKTIQSYLINGLFLALASLAPFFFPWQFALAVGIIASLIVPPAAVITGGLLDILYYDGTGFPYFTIIGIIVAIIAFFVQQFIKTRIMS
jgi:hypothetical protein